MNTHDALGEVVVHAHGRVSPAEHVYAHDKIAHLGRVTGDRVMAARVDLIAHADPARQLPALAKGELKVDRQTVRAHAEAETMTAAVDALQARLRERLERHRERERAQHLRHRDGEGAWRHDDVATPRPAYYPRPVEEREVVRRKTFALGAMTPDDAAADLEQLDHDFFLFRNAGTGSDNVIQRVADGCYELIQPSGDEGSDASEAIQPSQLHPSTMSADSATELLDLGDLPFVFFVDEGSGRAAVVYRRYDGHYGMVIAADEVGESTGRTRRG
jgi:ribosome-associated translation inhibitor RaiA